MRFENPVVIVLGAGASKPFGFPLGEALKSKIRDDLISPVPTEARVMVEAVFNADLIEGFQRALTMSSNRTIDALLEDRPNFGEIGRFSIARLLSTLEMESTIFPKTDWYGLLFDELGFRTSDSTPRVRGIITFNYDRSLEFFLSQSVEETFAGKAREEARKRLDALPIVHVHGSLGDYPRIPFRPRTGVEEIKQAAAALRLIQDSDLDNSPEFTQAKQLLESVDEAHFIGFGWNERNLRRLGLAKVRDGLKLYGTAVGMDERTLRTVYSALGGRATFTNAQASPYLTNQAWLTNIIGNLG